MKHLMITLVVSGSLVLSGCGGMSPATKTVVGATGGAAAGYLAADALGADSDWKLISGLAGAAAGTMVARHKRKNRCAYSNGNGSYYTKRC